MRRMRVAVTGAAGMIGASVVAGLAARFEPIPLARADLDIVDPVAVDDFMRNARPDVVVNMGAVADPSRCEADPEAARRVNVDGVANLARSAARFAARLIHYSTDLVFDGAVGHYVETDSPNPITLYGRLKLASEEAAMAFDDKETAVVRTAVVFGLSPSGRKTFFEAAVAAARRGEAVAVFTDQYRSFLYLPDAPRIVEGIIDQGATGLFHAGGEERLSRHELMERSGALLKIAADRFVPTPMAALPGLSPPADCSMKSDKLTEATGWRPTPVDEALTAMVDAL